MHRSSLSSEIGISSFLLSLLLAVCLAQTNPCARPDLQFSCRGTADSCISASWRCDGRDDCGNGMDEANCTCQSSQFNCETGDRVPTCIGLLRRCDGVMDCPNHKDEGVQCACDTSVQFECHSADRLCIERAWLCDGTNDCVDGSDELSCPSRPRANLTCIPGELACTDQSRCIPQQWHCDGQVDCSDGSDERADCPTSAPSQMCLNRRYCANLRQCFPSVFFCDGERDCIDGSDESNATCVNGTRGHLFLRPEPCPSGNPLDCNGRPLYLLFSVSSEIRLLELGNSSNPRFLPIVSNATNIVPVGYVQDDNSVSRVFYVDHTTTAERARFLTTTLDLRNSNVTGADPKEFMTNYMDTPQGFAVDWLGKNIYWTATDGNSVSSVQVARLDGTHHQTILRLDSGTTLPGHIVVDYKRGILFWAERFATPRIMRSTVLGKNVVQFSPLENQVFGTPSALAIDVDGQQIFVSDRLNGNVERITYAGKRSLLFRDKIEGIRSMDFFSGILYATQIPRAGVTNGRILRVDTNAGTEGGRIATEVRGNVRSPQDIRVVFGTAQPDDLANPCRNASGGCEGLCFTFGGEAVCSCNSVSGRPFLAANGRTCVQEPVVQVDITEVSLDEGGSQNIMCSVVSSPYLVVVELIWALNGVPLSPDHYSQRNNTDFTGFESQLTLQNVAEGGSYTCQLRYVYTEQPSSSTATLSNATTQRVRPASPVTVVVNKKSSNTTTIVVVVVVVLVVLSIIIVIIIAVVIKRRKSSGSTTFGNPIFGNKADEEQVTIVRTNSSASAATAKSDGGNGTSI